MVSHHNQYSFHAKEVNSFNVYPGEEIEVAKYCIKVTANSSKYKVVYLT